MGFETKPDIRPLHNRVLVGDCLAELKKIPAGSVDLVFADPPYNLQLAGDLTRPTKARSMRSTTIGTSSRVSPAMMNSPGPGSRNAAGP